MFFSSRAGGKGTGEGAGLPAQLPPRVTLYICKALWLYTTPCAIMALATFMKPAMLAPFT